MPAVRLDRVFATAIVLVLTAASSGVRAGPMTSGTSGTEGRAVSPAKTEEMTLRPTAATARPAVSANRTMAVPAPGSDQSPTTPTATGTVTAPGAALEQSSSPPAAAASEAPAITLQQDEFTEERAPPAAATGTEPQEEPTAARQDTTATPNALPPASAPPAEPATANPSATQPAASAVAAADAPVAEQLRELANGKFDRIIGSKKERTAIDAFYSSRNYAPLWISDGKANARAKAAVAYLGGVDADGLDPVEYPVPDLESLSDPGLLAEAEIRLTTSVTTYAHHAQVGRVHWSRVSADIFYEQKPPEAPEVLAKMAEAKDVGDALAGYEPRDPAYLTLKAKLAELRAGKGDGSEPPIANGQVLKVGMQDERVPQLRERLGVAGTGTGYDKTLAEAVRKFQQEHELKATGMVTAATLEALNGRRPDHPTDIVLANMERWRWMPHDLGNTYVVVNLADFTLRVMHDGKELWTTKVVDGKPTMPTPITSAEMKYITVNPTWNVPPSIVAREYLPALQQDPTILQRAGLRLSYNPDGTVHISQPPGERNALGRLRFNFPNKFLVYQHDTPDKNLFALEKRAFSHGCMRVQDPAKYAEVLLSLVRPGQGYTEDRIRRMFGTSETDISFPNFVPVHLTYQTAFVDKNGKLQFRDDIYGRDKALLAILKSDERKVADIPVERKDNAIRRQALAIPDQMGFWGGRGSYDGQGFFARLFGYPFSAAPPPTPRRPVAQRRTSASGWPPQEQRW